MSVLSAAKEAAKEIGISQPSALIAATDDTGKHFLRIANQEGYELARRYPWEELTKEYTFSTAASDEDYALPSDFGWVVPDTAFDRTNRRQLIGPITAQKWQRMKADSLQSGLDTYWRLRGSQILLIPTPAEVRTIACEYIMDTWCTDSGGSTYRTAFAADTDVTILPEELLILGMVWRFKKAKGLDYAADFAVYEQAVNDHWSKNKGYGTISMGSQLVDPLLTANIPDQGYSFS